MGKRDRRFVDLADFKAKKRDEGAIDIKGEDGEIYRIDPPEVWPDEAQTLAASGEVVGAATVLLGGPERYEAFIKAGGSASVVMAIIADEHGLTAGESSGSSGS